MIPINFQFAFIDYSQAIGWKFSYVLNFGWFIGLHLCFTVCLIAEIIFKVIPVAFHHLDT